MTGFSTAGGTEAVTLRPSFGTGTHQGVRSPTLGVPTGEPEEEEAMSDVEFRAVISADQTFKTALTQKFTDAAAEALRRAVNL